MNILRMVCDRDDNNYTVWSTSIPVVPKVPSKYPPSFHGSSSCCIILCILHHEWIVTVVVTFDRFVTLPDDDGTEVVGGGHQDVAPSAAGSVLGLISSF